MGEAEPYANPYTAGVVLGLVLVACFVLTGQGLGASGAAASLVTAGVAAASPQAVAGNGYFAGYAQPSLPWSSWTFIEILGVLAGGALSAVLAGRFRPQLRRGPTSGITPRLVFAFGGGAVMGLGAVLARGCTSGLGLSGGAMLSAGSWAFLLALFVSGFAVAPLVRRLWQ